MKGRLQGFFEGLNISANEPTFGGYIFPEEKPFEIKQSLVRPKLNNGQEWNHPGKPMPRLETIYPHDSFRDGVPLPKHKDMLVELRGQDMTGLNLTPAPLPFYPEDARVKALAEGNQEKENAMREMHHPAVAKEPLGFVEEAAKNLQLRNKYSPETFDRLIALGFSEEDIAKAVQDEVQKDIRAVLDNPGAYTREIDTAAALESMYEKWAGKRAERETGTDGAILGNTVQNPNTYRAAGTLGENVPIKAKTGAQRMMQEQRVKSKDINFERPGSFQQKERISYKDIGDIVEEYNRPRSNAAGGGGGVTIEEIRKAHKERAKSRGGRPPGPASVKSLEKQAQSLLATAQERAEAKPEKPESFKQMTLREFGLGK